MNVDYDLIDTNIINVIKYLNEDIDVETIFSCSGHGEEYLRYSLKDPSHRLKGYFAVIYSERNLKLLDELRSKICEVKPCFKYLESFGDKVTYYNTDIVIWTNVLNIKMIFFNVDFTTVINFGDLGGQEAIDDMIKEYWISVVQVLKQIVKTKQY